MSDILVSPPASVPSPDRPSVAGEPLPRPADRAPALSDVRRLFPGATQVTYLDLAGRGLLSIPVKAAIDAHVDEAMAGRIDKTALFERTERSRERFAALINARPDEVTFTKNTSEGINMVAGAIPWQRGDNMILCAALEHPNNVYAWLHLQRLGVEVRMLPDEQGSMPVEAMIAAMDDRTRLVTASTVSFTPGFRTDVAALGRACRARGAIFLVDAAQSAGVIHADVVASSIDALATSTQKGLLALYGMGYLYIRQALAERMVPGGVARFGLDIGPADAHESDLGDGALRFLAGARRFDLGNYNYIGVHAVNASLELLLAIGTPAIEAHVTALARALANGLLDLGLPVFGGRPDGRLAHIVTVGRHGARTGGSELEASMQSLYAHLQDNGVRLSIRRGLLRFAFHLYNDASDVDRVLSLVRQWPGLASVHRH